MEKRYKGEAGDMRVYIIGLMMSLVASLKLEKAETRAAHIIFPDMLLTLREESENQI